MTNREQEIDRIAGIMSNAVHDRPWEEFKSVSPVTAAVEIKRATALVDSYKHTEKCPHCGGTKKVFSLSANMEIPCPVCVGYATQHSLPGYCPDCNVSRIPPFLKRCSRCCDTEEKQTEQAALCEENSWFYNNATKTSEKK